MPDFQQNVTSFGPPPMGLGWGEVGSRLENMTCLCRLRHVMQFIGNTVVQLDATPMAFQGWKILFPLC